MLHKNRQKTRFGYTLQTSYYPKGTYPPLPIKSCTQNNEGYYSKTAKAVILRVGGDTEGESLSHTIKIFP